MSNNQITKRFFTAIDEKTKSDILSAIAAHYTISKKQAEEEVLDDEAESLVDYLTGSIRTAASLLMKRHGMA